MWIHSLQHSLQESARSIRHTGRGRPGVHRRRIAALAAAIALAWAAQPARALSIGGAGGPALGVDPVYFNGFGVFGLDPSGLTPDYYASAPVSFLSAANATGADLQVTQNLQQPPWQHPQDPANSRNPGTNGGVPSTPTTARPFVADSVWTIRNTSGRALADVLLLFTRTIPGNGYPALDVALDDSIVSVLSYTNLDEVTRDYAAVALGDLAPGQSVDILVRYIVAGPLPVVSSRYLMPSLGLAGIEGFRPVPEPATVLLMAGGLAWLAARRRA
jgi:hypothetical protein